MRSLACFVLATTMLAPGCATYAIQTMDLTLQPGGWVHVHGKELHVKARSRGPGTLNLSVLDGTGQELSGGSLGVGHWTGGDRRATDVWIRNESTSIVQLDVWAGGSGTVAVSTLEKPVEGR